MTDNQTVRYGILSTASIVPRFVKGMELCGNGTVDAIASRDIHKAEAAAQELGIKRAYGDYHELLADPYIDAVYIPVINSMHYTYAKDALLKGKHVIVEKPFVLHASEAEELFALAEEKGLFLTEAVKTPHLPLYERITDIIASEELGKIRFMDFRQSYTSGPYIGGWNREEEYGGGVLFGNEAYFFHMAEFLNGPIRSCTGVGSFFDDYAESQCTVTAGFENQAIAVLAVSNNVLFDNGLTIYLDRGRIRIPDYWKADRAEIITEDGELRTLSCPCKYEFRYELHNYNECILNGKPESPLVPHERTVRFIRWCEEMKKEWQNEKP